MYVRTYPTFPETMATGLLHRALLFSSALATRSQACAHTGTHATALSQAFQRTAAALAAPITALTPHSSSSRAHSGLHTASLALTHNAPHSQILEPTRPERDIEAALLNVTPAARTHKQPHPLNPPAALPGPARQHKCPCNPLTERRLG